MATVVDFVPSLRALSLPEDLHERLLALSALTSGGLSPQLLDALHAIEDVADEDGHDALLARGLADPALREHSPQALAVLALLEHPEILKSVASSRPPRARSFREYPGKLLVPARDFTRGDIDALADQFGCAFEARHRSRHCRIRVVAESRTLAFQIAHGRPTRQERIIEDRPRDPERPFLLHEGETTYRPQQYDLVIYDPRSGHLKAQARDATTMRMYTRGFGELLFGDPEWFKVGQVVSLGPLAELGRLALEPTPGILHVQLVEVKLGFPEIHPDLVITIRVPDVFAVLDGQESVSLDGADLLAARLRIRYLRGRARSLELRPPDTLRYDHRRDRSATLHFLEERGFLDIPAVVDEAA